jgi:PhnB protein
MVLFVVWMKACSAGRASVFTTTSSRKDITMNQFVPYLGFDGNCRQAMHHYETVLQGKLETMMSGAESPMADQIPKAFADRIVHACLALPGGGTLFAGDAPAHLPYEGIKGVSITMNYDSVNEAERVFKALSEGGQVTMPMARVFWAKACGMLTDKFGVPWIINGENCPSK